MRKSEFRISTLRKSVDLPFLLDLGPMQKKELVITPIVVKVTTTIFAYHLRM